MGKFFKNQKLDAPGLLGITLQKLLVFFMVLDVFGMFSGSFFTSFITLLFHFVVFMGVYRRRTAVLCMYVVVHIVLFVLVALVLIVAVTSMMYMPADQYASADSYGDDVYYSNSTTSYYASRAISLFSGSHNTNSSTHHNSTTPVHPIPYNSGDSDVSTSEGSEYGISDTLFLLIVILLILSFIILYTKILSVVLAHRMRKMLLAVPTLPVRAPEPSEPTYIPAEFEAQQQFFAGHPAYYMQVPLEEEEYPGNQGAMMPPPFMYGNQPVYYTYAPMPQPPTNQKH